MLITFLVVIAPFLMLVPPLQRNRFFILYFAMMMGAAYITESYFFRVKMFSSTAFLLFAVYHFACVNVATFLAYAADKRAAKRGEWRIPEAHLHALEFLGGWIGAFAAQKICHHKNKKRSYQVMFWLMIVLQGAAVYIILRYLRFIR